MGAEVTNDLLSRNAAVPVVADGASVVPSVGACLQAICDRNRLQAGSYLQTAVIASDSMPCRRAVHFVSFCGKFPCSECLPACGVVSAGSAIFSATV